MNLYRLSAAICFVVLFLGACNSTRTDEAASSPTYPNSRVQPAYAPNNDYWARDNFNLQAVGDVFRQSNSAEDFERRLNQPNGVNNLDLNGDGYADYISVAEYQDRDTGYRGFSLFDRFGDNGNLIQEIATIILDRTLNGGRDSRVYIDGNDQIYGRDYFYQGDWKDTALNIANWAFQNRDGYYTSPYYYENYPDYYQTYQIVETPVYVTRVQQDYIPAQPVFVQTAPVTIQYQARSPYDGRSYDQIYANLAEPNAAQKEFKKANPNPPTSVPKDRPEKVKNIPPGLNKPEKAEEAKPEKEAKVYKEKEQRPDRIDRPEQPRPQPERAKPDNPGKNRGGEMRQQNTPSSGDNEKGNGKGKGEGGGNGKGNNGNGGGNGGGKGNGGGGGKGKGKG